MANKTVQTIIVSEVKEAKAKMISIILTEGQFDKLTRALTILHASSQKDFDESIELIDSFLFDLYNKL